MKTWLYIWCVVTVGWARAEDAPNSVDSAGSAHSGHFPSVFSQAPSSSFDSSQQPRTSGPPTFGVAPAAPAAPPVPADQVAVASSAPAAYSHPYAEPVHQQSSYVQQPRYPDQVAIASSHYGQPGQHGYYYYYYPIKESIKKKDKKKKWSLWSLLFELPASDLLRLPDFLGRGDEEKYYEKVKSLAWTATSLLISLGGALLLMPMFNFAGRQLRSWPSEWINRDDLNTVAEFVLKAIDGHKINRTGDQ